MRWTFKDTDCFRNTFPFNRLQIANFARGSNSPNGGLSSIQQIPVRVRRAFDFGEPPATWSDSCNIDDMICLPKANSGGGTWTLLAGSNFSQGHTLIFKDDQGLDEGATITITAAGSDTIDGDGVKNYEIAVSYGSLILVWDGTSSWQVY